MKINKTISMITALNIVCSAFMAFAGTDIRLTVSAAENSNSMSAENDPVNENTDSSNPSEDFSYYTAKDSAVSIIRYTGTSHNVVIPSEIDGLPVTEIDDGAFRGNTNINSVVIPESVKKIGSGAFSSCFFLSDISLTDSVEYIGNEAFNNTAWLENQPEGIVYIGNFAYSYKPGEKKETELTFRENTTGISDEFAFLLSSKFSGITRVDLPDSLRYITPVTFHSLSDLSCFNVSEDNPYFMSDDGILFSKDRSKLIKYPVQKTGTSYIIPSQTKIIADRAFMNCNYLSEVEMSDSVTDIGDSAFSYCHNLNKIKLSDKIKTISCRSFRSTSISEISLPLSLTSIDNEAFAFTHISEVTVPESVTSIGYGSFASCQYLTEITFLNPDCIINTKDGVISKFTISNGFIPDTGVLVGGGTAYGPYSSFEPNDDACSFEGTIIGHTGSMAQKYAESCGYKFVCSDDTGEIIYGDIDLNGSVDMTDLTQLSLFCLGDIKLNDKAKKNADVTGDDKIDLADLAHLKQFIMLEPVHLGPAD